jgi:hypothetical protein
MGNSPIVRLVRDYPKMRVQLKELRQRRLEAESTLAKVRAQVSQQEAGLNAHRDSMILQSQLRTSQALQLKDESLLRDSEAQFAQVLKAKDSMAERGEAQPGQSAASSCATSEAVDEVARAMQDEPKLPHKSDPPT